MRIVKVLTRLGILSAALALAACADFRTSYSAPVPAEQSAGWRLAGVSVTVPETLSVSEARTLLPNADIVWREDPPGDRRAQVATILTDATRQGAAGLKGGTPVRLELTVSRFHALTFEAEQRLQRAGVHDIEFVLRAVDARTGRVLAGPDMIEASLPALSGIKMLEARARGASQKSHITAHVRRVIAGWLSLGPDPRVEFTRIGG
ncbi:hypothetical protein DEA8626_01270 [Defluviimonas aquaemixtae]|uniref:Lipoprotein n=1 Tax=Albidovulum aquaemixtae TaxID=1542388 RepID=A0A2R8B5D9_9RHOB|nr:DUF6778 family protein [Defluviimonas aquaemixtae]SPH17743.1 hypothetical protein DEA8626_01270 [Defluviimonas aquaemixtae]